MITILLKPQIAKEGIHKACESLLY